MGRPPATITLPTDQLQLANTLRSARIASGLSVQAVATQIGLSKQQMSSIEIGRIRSPSPEMLVRLARLFNMNPPDLLRLAGHATLADLITSGGKSAEPRPAKKLSFAGETLSEAEASELQRHLRLIRGAIVPRSR